MNNSGMGNDALVELVRANILYREHPSPEYDRVLEAMRITDRRKFLLQVVLDEEERRRYTKHRGVKHISERAYEDTPLSIGHGQPCSQPSLVAFMAFLLELEEGMKVLEIGSGCGYSAAITYHLISPSGYLVTIERIPELAELARKNLRAHFDNVNGLERVIQVVTGDGSIGLENEGPFDRIYLTAGVNLRSFDPAILARQLNPNGGILLFPEPEGNLIKQRYEGGSPIREERYKDVWFVPLVGENS